MSFSFWLAWFSGAAAGASLEVQQPSSLAGSYYHFSLAKIFYLNEQYPSAIREFRAALEIDPDSSVVRTELARALIESGDAERAVEECEKAVALDPQNADAHFLLGRIYRTTGGPDAAAKALAEFDKVVGIDARHVEALYEAAEMLRQAGEFEKAADYYQRIRNLSPGLARVYESEAEAWMRAGSLEKAVQALEEGRNVQQGNLRYILFLGNLYVRAGQNQKAIDLFESELEELSSAELAQALAGSYLEAGRVDEAVQLLEKSVQEFPGELDLKSELGKAYRQAKRIPESEAIFREVLEKNPNDLDTIYELANCLEIQGDREEALSLFERLVQMTNPAAKPYRALFEKRLALLYQELGRMNEAIELFQKMAAESPEDVQVKIWLFYALKKASRIDEGLALTEKMYSEFPDDPYVAIARSQSLSSKEGLVVAVRFLENRLETVEDKELLFVGISQLYMEQEDFASAQASVEKGIKVLPDSEKLLFQLGAILERRQEYEAAEERFRKLLERNPEQAETLNYLGYMLAERGVRLEEALAYTQKAVEMDPYNGAYLDSLGWVYFKQNQLDQAEIFLLKAARINRTDPTILEHLGDLYVQLGDFQKARTYYDRSLENAQTEEESGRVKQKLEDLEDDISVLR